MITTGSGGDCNSSKVLFNRSSQQLLASRSLFLAYDGHGSVKHKAKLYFWTQ